MLSVYARKVGTVASLCLQGRIVAGEMVALRNAVDDLADITAVVLDLKRVSIIDAAGFGLLLELRHNLKVKGIEFKLENLAERINRLFAITRLNTVFEIAPSATVSPINHLKRRLLVSELAPCA